MKLGKIFALLVAFQFFAVAYSPLGMENPAFAEEEEEEDEDEEDEEDEAEGEDEEEDE